jgi:hypothetical protein
MTKQLFRNDVPPTLLFDLLEKICFKTETYYLVDQNAYKKLLFYKYNEQFAEDIVEYYHYSKQFYATRKMTYKSFINIIRHICKQSNIMYTSNIKYNKSLYNIDYCIYF